jgi:hypothetical protein
VEKYARVRQATGGNVIRNMEFVCWMTKATDPYTEYVLLTAVALQQELSERDTILRYMYMACPVCHHHHHNYRAETHGVL